MCFQYYFPAKYSYDTFQIFFTFGLFSLRDCYTTILYILDVNRKARLLKHVMFLYSEQRKILYIYLLTFKLYNRLE